MLALSGAARADLQADVERVRLAWASSSKVATLRPRLLERGTLRPLFLSRESTNPNADDCTTVAVLGAPSSNFLLRFLPPEQAGALYRDWPEPSIAGVTQLTRCGARKKMLSRIAVEMRSPRGVLEFLVARSTQPVPSLLKVLPHRDPGPPGQRRETGPRASLPPLDERVASAQRKNLRENGRDPHERKIMSSRNGSGQKLFRLDPGCHRFDVLGYISPDDENPVDIDIVVGSVAEQELLAEDRSDNADASVQVCVGRQEIVKLNFQGAAARSPVTVVLASWPIPAGLPEAWGARARARMAEAAGTGQFPALKHRPVFSTLGVQGATALPLEVVPGGCYLAVIGAIRGTTQGIAIAARTGSFTGQNQSSRETTSTGLAFCTDGDETALIEVEAHGAGLGWLLGVWQVSHVPLGEPRQ
jgi:hypothetical protein